MEDMKRVRRKLDALLQEQLQSDLLNAAAVFRYDVRAEIRGAGSGSE